MRILADRFVLSDGQPRRGGMAEIYRAVDHRDNLRAVAVKFMDGSRVRDDRILREAFSRELTALNALDHRNIVKIIDFDPRHDPPYLVLEWLEQDLSTYLETTTIRGWDDFYDRIGCPVLDALAYALTKRLTHRDLKPGNVLIDNDGTPKVADFGISKFYHQGPGGITLAAFKSEPYAPFEELSSYESRDPFSFAVLALRCLTARKLSTHEEVATALGGFSDPPEVRDVLLRALHPEPLSRFANVVELQSALEKIRAAGRVQRKGQRVCHVVVFAQALGRLSLQLGEHDENKTRRLLEQDIAESCSFFFWRDRESGRKVARHFLVRTAQFGLRLAVSDKSGDHLVLQSAWLDDSNGAHGDFGFHAPITFRFSRPPPGTDGITVIRWLLDAVEQHELDDEDARRARKEEEVLREWASTLRFRQYLEESRHAPISYDEYRVEGNRVKFSVASLPDGVVLEQPRMIRHDQRVVLSGVVDDIAVDRLVLWVEKGVIEPPPPSKGQLVIDDRASRVAIDRQKAALDAVRYGRCVRPSLRTFILDPKQSQAPSHIDANDVKWIHAQFDDDKKAAVAKALGASDILVVHGPPGTGKTVFITELIAQLLERTPDCKILLTSQTHVALDNALERLHGLRPTARLLRVAQRDDERVSAKVQDLTIDKVAKRWQSDIAKASELFLSTAASNLGVRREDIALGIAAGRLRAESAELDSIQARLNDCEKIISAAEQKLEEAKVGNVADEYAETSEELDVFREQVRELRERQKTVGTRRREAARELAACGEIGAQLAKATTSELAEWEHGLLEGNTADRKFHDLIRLAEQWQLRFGRSREFYAAMIADSSVVAGTCLGFARIPGMLSAEFDICIVDEASKATATELLVPLSRARRWILVGDPKQLPPFVEDLLDDPDLLKDYDLNRESFQTTLLDRFVAALPDVCIASLKTQHRMVRPIGDLISACFYGGTLRSVRDERDECVKLVMPEPVTWLTTAGIRHHDETESKGSFKNICEARLIGQWLKRLDFVAKMSDHTYRVGVITGYVGQCTELRRVVASLQSDLSTLSIECNTVDAFQGREVDVCVYSVTRCNDHGVIGFLRDERRMNVALSRGRTGLLIVGDHLFCRTAKSPNPLRTVVEYIEDHSNGCTVIAAEAGK